MLTGLLLQPVGMPLSEAEWRPKMERYVRGAQWQRASSLLSTVREAGGELSPGAYQAAITACARAEPPQWRAALRVLEDSRKYDAVNEKVWSAAIHACRTEWRSALSLLQRMHDEEGMPLNLYAATATVRALGDAGEWERAREVFRELVGSAAPSDAAASGVLDGEFLQATMMACARAGRVRETLDILREYAPAGTSTAATYRNMGHAHVDWLSATGTSDDGESEEDGDEGAPVFGLDVEWTLDSDALDHTVVVAYANANRLDEGLALLRHRTERGLPVNAASYNVLLRAARAAALPDTSLIIFDALVQTGLPISDTSYALGLGPPLMRDATWRPALRALASVLATRERPSVRAQEELLMRCADGKQGEAAEALLTLMSDNGAISPRALPRLYERALEACAKARATRSANRILAALETEAAVQGRPEMLRPSAYASAIDACPSWAWATALQMWRRMLRARVTPDTRCGLSALRAMRRGGRWREAVALLRSLEGAYGIYVDEELLGTCCGACEKAGAWWPALQAHQRLPYTGRSLRKERGLALLVGVCGGSGRPNLEAKMRREVAAVAQASGAFELDDVHAALGLAALGGQWETALQVMRSLNRPLLGITRGADDGLVEPQLRGTDGVEGDVGDGDIDEAAGDDEADGGEGGVSGPMRLSLRPDPMTFSLLISAAERGSQWALLLRLHSAFSRDGMWKRQAQANEAGYDAVATQAAVQAHCALNDWEAAYGLLQAMENFGLRPSRDTCERVLFTMSRARSTDGAAACDAAGRLLQHMLDEGPAPGRAGFEAVVHALARRGRVAECRRLMDQMVQIGDIAVEVSTLSAAFGGVLGGRRIQAAIQPAASADPSREAPDDDAPSSHYRGAVLRRPSAPSPAASVLRQVHALHSHGVDLGLLPPVSPTLVDVRSLPTPVAIGSVLATLEALRQSSEDPAVIITAPLTIRAEAHSPALTKCRKAISRWARVVNGQRPPLVYAPAPVSALARPRDDMAREEGDGLVPATLGGLVVDDLIGHELVLPTRSLRSWLRTARFKGGVQPPAAHAPKAGARRGRGARASEAYWEHGDSTLQ